MTLCSRIGLFGVLLVTATASAAALLVQPIDLTGQAQPSVLAIDTGFVLTSVVKSGVRAHLRFAELDFDGQTRRQGEIASGLDWFVNWADFPNLVVADNGDWVSFFLAKSDPGKPYAYDIRVLRSRDRGATWSMPVTIHQDGVATEHGFVTLLPAGKDRVLVAWLDGRRGASANTDGHGHESAHTALYTAEIDRQGRIFETRELDDLTCDCCQTDGLRIDEQWLLAYRDRTTEEIRDIGFIRRTGRRWSSPGLIHQDRWKMPGCPVNGPALSRFGPGVLAVWPTFADGKQRIRLARLDSVGTNHWRFLGELEAHAELAGRVDAAPFADGHALVSWLGVGDEGTVLRIAEVDGDGKKRHQQDVATLPPGRMTGVPRLASAGATALLTWTEPAREGSRVRGFLIRSAAE